MEELVCRKCGLCQSPVEANVTKKPLAAGGYHLIARCYDCDAFIKNIRHEKTEMLWYGKYKGKAISTVAREDSRYLKWLLTTNNLKPNLRSAIERELNKEPYAEEPVLFSRP